MSEVLTIQNISKSYGPVQALKQVSFSVPEGSVFGILGPNGSGKTTLLAILLNVLKANNGGFQWFGSSDNQLARRQIGTLLETPNFYHYLSAVKNLRINAGLKHHGLNDIDRVLEVVRLAPRKHSKFSTYSLGMKQRLAIANALLGNPKVLVLDEPTNGLDPEGIAEIRELIKELNRQGTTIIMASHLLDEVEKVCTHVAILKHGDLLLSGDVKQVLQNEDVLEISAADTAQLRAILQPGKLIKDMTIAGDSIQLILQPGIQPEDLNRFCFEKGISLRLLHLKKKSLETKFMELTRV
jgi:ABC-2 type transport system ATP-binding protein